MIALVVAVGTGTAWAATYVVSSNSQIGPDTVSGHKVTGSNHANIVAGSIAGSDLAPSFYNEPWQVIAENARTATDPCYSRSDTFCGDSNNGVWTNYGGEWMGLRFYRAAGVVHVEGLIKFVPLGNPQTALISKAIFILPRTYRPAKKLVFGVDCAKAGGTGVTHGRIDVTDDGIVLWNPGFDNCEHTNYISLSGISYRAEK